MAGISLCDKNEHEQVLPVLVNKKIISANEYLIVCNGYPKKGITNPTQKRELAKEAALLNAQIIAANLFKKELDVIKNGNIRKYNLYDDYAEIEYIIKKENVKKYLKK